MEHLTGRTILIVEDVFLIASAVEHELLRRGAASVRLAPSAARVQDILGVARVDAAILDVNLEGDDSYALADRLAAMAVPFIFATALAPDEIPTRFSQIPVFVKPYAVEDLVANLCCLVNARQNPASLHSAQRSGETSMGQDAG
jgi:DNA-binding response OmpR family regulator